MSCEEFVKVVENDSCEVVELPVESDRTLLLATLRGQFSHAVGLKYRVSSAYWCELEVSGNVVNPPEGGWELDTVYHISTITDGVSNKNVKDDYVKTTQLQINQQFLQLSLFIEVRKDSSDVQHIKHVVDGTQQKIIDQFKGLAKILTLSKGADTIVIDDEHDDEIIQDVNKKGLSSASAHQAPCKYFKMGVCKWGSKCKLLHPGVKRRKEDSPKATEETSSKISRYTNEKADDVIHELIVRKLPYQCKCKELKFYFTSACGEMETCNIRYMKKKGPVGFIKFKTIKGEKEALSVRHMIKGCLLDVKIKSTRELQLYVTGVPAETTVKDLKDHFGQFGEVHYVNLPQPERGFAFVTLMFISDKDYKSTLTRDHTIKLETPHKKGFFTLTVKKATPMDKSCQKLSQEMITRDICDTSQENVMRDICHTGDSGGDVRNMGEGRSCMDNSDNRQGSNYGSDAGYGTTSQNMRDLPDANDTRDFRINERYSDYAHTGRNYGNVSGTTDTRNHQDNIRYSDSNRRGSNYESDSARGTGSPLHMQNTLISNRDDRENNRLYSDSDNRCFNYGSHTTPRITSSLYMQNDTRGVMDHRDNGLYSDSDRRGVNIYGDDTTQGTVSPIYMRNNVDAMGYRDNRRFSDPSARGDNYGNHITQGTASPLQMQNDRNDMREYGENRRYSDSNNTIGNYRNDATQGVAAQLKNAIYSILRGNTSQEGIELLQKML